MNELQQQLFAADLREAVMEIAAGGWKGRDGGLSLERTVEVAVTAAEDFVQSVVRAAGQ